MSDADTQTLFAPIRLLGLDVDGVLTDGGVYVFEDGQQFRRFNIKDGLGIKNVMAVGVDVIIISSSAVQAVRHRAESLGIQHVYLGIGDKLATLQHHCTTHQIQMSDVAFMGDDLADLPLMQQVGVPLAVADAVPAVVEAARYVTHLRGGYGAVREVCDLLVAAKRPTTG